MSTRNNRPWMLTAPYIVRASGKLFQPSSIAVGDLGKGDPAFSWYIFDTGASCCYHALATSSQPPNAPHLKHVGWVQRCGRKVPSDCMVESKKPYCGFGEGGPAVYGWDSHGFPWVHVMSKVCENRIKVMWWTRTIYISTYYLYLSIYLYLYLYLYFYLSIYI